MTPGEACEFKPVAGLGGWRPGIYEGVENGRAIVRSGDKRYRVQPSRVRPSRHTKPDARPKAVGTRQARALTPTLVRAFTLAGQPNAPPARNAPMRSPAFLAFVRQHPCAICGAAGPSEAHHYGPRGMGQKTDDLRCVPLCRRCHDQWHTKGAPPALDVLVRVLERNTDLLIAWLRSAVGE